MRSPGTWSDWGSTPRWRHSRSPVGPPIMDVSGYRSSATSSSRTGTPPWRHPPGPWTCATVPPAATYTTPPSTPARSATRRTTRTACTTPRASRHLAAPWRRPSRPATTWRVRRWWRSRAARGTSCWSGYFTRESLRRVFRDAGFRVERIEESFGGQFLGLHGRAAGPLDGGSPPDRIEGDDLAGLGTLVTDFRQAYAAKVAHWERELGVLRQGGGRAVVWGAGSKGVSLSTPCPAPAPSPPWWTSTPSSRGASSR